MWVVSTTLHISTLLCYVSNWVKKNPSYIFFPHIPLLASLQISTISFILKVILLLVMSFWQGKHGGKQDSTACGYLPINEEDNASSISSLLFLPIGSWWVVKLNTVWIRWWHVHCVRCMMVKFIGHLNASMKIEVWGFGGEGWTKRFILIPLWPRACASIRRTASLKRTLELSSQRLLATYLRNS